MGRNTFNRQSFTEEQLKTFVEFTINNPLRSLRSEKIFETEKQWRADVSRLMDDKSSKTFYFLLSTVNGNPHCFHCDAELGIESFDKIGYHRKFSKYCPICIENKVWHEHVTEDQLKDRGSKITQAKLAFYQTETGKEVAKRIGEKNSVNMKSFHKTDQGTINREKNKQLMSSWLSERIMNGSFTPNSNNRNTHWNSSFNGKTYRSSWEALYQYFYNSDEHETLRIKYTFENQEYVYIVDFVNYETKIVTEVKPEEFWNDEKFKAKFEALSKWCAANGFSARIAGQTFFREHGMPHDMTVFDESTQRKIRKLYE